MSAEAPEEDSMGFELVSHVHEEHDQHTLDLASDVSELTLSSRDADEPLCQGFDTSDEEAQAQVSAPIVGLKVAKALEPGLSDFVVYRHVRSGFCHLSKNDNSLDADDDSVVLKCGKLATRNFEKVEMRGNYTPHKCTRCFSQGASAAPIGTGDDA